MPSGLPATIRPPSVTSATVAPTSDGGRAGPAARPRGRPRQLGGKRLAAELLDEQRHGALGGGLLLAAVQPQAARKVASLIGRRGRPLPQRVGERRHPFQRSTHRPRVGLRAYHVQGRHDGARGLPAHQARHRVARQVEPRILLVHAGDRRDAKLAHQRRRQVRAGQAVAPELKAGPRSASSGCRGRISSSEPRDGLVGSIGEVVVAAEHRADDGGLRLRSCFSRAPGPTASVRTQQGPPGLLFHAHAGEELVGVVDHPHGASPVLIPANRVARPAPLPVLGTSSLHVDRAPVTGAELVDGTGDLVELRGDGARGRGVARPQHARHGRQHDAGVAVAAAGDRVRARREQGQWPLAAPVGQPLPGDQRPLARGLLAALREQHQVGLRHPQPVFVITTPSSPSTSDASRTASARLRSRSGSVVGATYRITPQNQRSRPWRAASARTTAWFWIAWCPFGSTSSRSPARRRALVRVHQHRQHAAHVAAVHDRLVVVGRLLLAADGEDVADARQAGGRGSRSEGRSTVSTAAGGRSSPLAGSTVAAASASAAFSSASRRPRECWAVDTPGGAADASTRWCSAA